MLGYPLNKNTGQMLVTPDRQGATIMVLSQPKNHSTPKAKATTRRLITRTHDRVLRRRSLATLKWRKRKDAPTRDTVEEIIADIAPLNRPRMHFWLRYYGRDLIEGHGTPVYTCAQLFYALEGFNSGFAWFGREESTFIPRSVEKGDWVSNIDAPENWQKLAVYQAKFAEAYPDLV